MNIKGVIERSPNTYRFTVSNGFDGNGKNIRKTMTFKVPQGTSPTKAEKLVMEAYTEFRRKCKGSKDFDENMQFKELVEIYLEQYGVNELKPVTVCNYKRDLEMHILPVFANRKIRDISTKSLTAFFTTLDRSSETTRKLKNIMSSVFTYGVKQGYINNNPCIGALYKKDVVQQKKIKYLNKEQCQKLMMLTNEYSVVHSIIQFLLLTGLRIGECLALQWRDIDFVNLTITIEHTLSYAEHEWFLSVPKTKTSLRILKMGTYTRELLLRHREKQNRMKAHIVGEWRYPDIVFTTMKGNFYNRSCVNKELKKILKNNGLPPVSVHGLRHSNASLMINNGIDIKAVSEHLGHCNIAITGDIYSHIFEEYKTRIAQCIEETLV